MKLDLNNTVIKSLNNAHGANIIKWWKKQGADTGTLSGNLPLAYGLCDGEFANFNDSIKENNLKVVTLPNPLMNYCIKGTHNEVIPIYESIGINFNRIDEEDEATDTFFFIEDNEINTYATEKHIDKIIITPKEAKQMIEEFYAPDGYKAVTTSSTRNCVNCIFSGIGDCDDIHKANCLNSMRKDKCDVMFIKSKTAERRVDFFKRLALRNAFLAGVASTGEGFNGEYANGRNPDIENTFGKLADKYVSDILK
ncbi:hypothetical protein DSECCO2_120390 [anaerobic digester metagenome]